MGNLTEALQELRAERKQAQSHVEKLDTAISVIESLNGFGSFGKANQPTRIISAASRRKMAQAQRARWARARKESQPVAAAKTTASAPAKRTMSASARRKIAAFQRALGEVEGAAEEGCLEPAIMPEWVVPHYLGRGKAVASSK